MTCVRSRARDDCHHRQPDAERKITPVDEFPVVQADHTTLGDQTVLSIVHTGIKGGRVGLYDDQAESAEGQPDEGDREESEGGP